MTRRTFAVDWKPGMRTEEDVIVEICAYLTLRHIPFIRTHSARRRPLRPGTPDLIGCLPKTGRMFQVEAKGDDGIVSKDQEELMREFHQAGAIVIVARSLDDVIKAGL